MFKKYIFLALLAFSGAASAELVSLPTQKIAGIRGEGSVALLSFKTPFPSGSGCQTRTWIPLSDDFGKAKFSMALTAFAAGKDVMIRAHNDESTKVYSECKIYDIVILQ